MTYDGWNAFKQSDPPKFHMPIAVPGSGKSTLASNLVISGDIIETAIVSPDEFRERLTDDRGNQDFNGAVFSIVDRIVDARMRSKRDIFLDATNLTKRDRDKTLTKATAAGYEIIVYVWATPREVILKRNKNRQHPVPDFVMDRMFQRLGDGPDLGDFKVTLVEMEKVYKGEWEDK